MLESIISVLADHLRVPEISVSDDKTLEDLGADSLDIIELAMLLEDEFGIEIADDDINIDMTVAALAEIVEKKVQA